MNKSQEAIATYIDTQKTTPEALQANHNVDYSRDSSGRIYETTKGYRTNGPRKTRLINQMNMHMLELGKKGVHVRRVLAHLGITGDSLTYTTKQWTGVIGMIVKFRRENNV
jgi:hypothetical protein